MVVIFYPRNTCFECPPFYGGFDITPVGKKKEYPLDKGYSLLVTFNNTICSISCMEICNTWNMYLGSPHLV
jgi:hypothetical protein